jgi:hypothetical protein
MKRWIKFSLIFLSVLVAGYFFLGYLSSFVGWYGYKKWRYRTSTISVDESKSRKVFVKELNFRISGFGDTVDNFHAYIEKGFRYGYHSSEVTRLLTNSKYPYQLSFNFHPRPNITVFIKSDNLVKFDSSNSSWGYLKYPFLKDTIELEIHEEGTKSGKIDVW